MTAVVSGVFCLCRRAASRPRPSAGADVVRSSVMIDSNSAACELVFDCDTPYRLLTVCRFAIEVD